MIEVLSNPESEQIVGVDARVVQHIDIRLQRVAEKCRKRAAVRDFLDPLQNRLQREKAKGLYAVLLHEARKVVANLAGLRTSCLFSCGRKLNQIGDPALDEFLDHIPIT